MSLKHDPAVREAVLQTLTIVNLRIWRTAFQGFRVCIIKRHKRERQIISIDTLHEGR